MAQTDAVPAAAVTDDVDAVLEILSSCDDDEVAEIVRLVAEICGVQAAGITLRRGEEYHVLATHGLNPLVCSAGDTFCQFTMGTDGVYVVEDAHDHPQLAHIGWVDGRLGNIRFYASAPIHAPDHTMVGRLCVVDAEPRTLTSLQRKALETLALSVTKLVELRLLQEVRRPSPSSLEARQSAATLMSQLAAELSHDLRVPLTSIVASVEMLAGELVDHHDPAVRALLGRCERAADRMVRMLEQHMRFGSPSPAAETTDVDLGRVARQLVVDSAPLLEPVGAHVEVGPLPVVHADADGLYSVLQNLLTNAVKYARPGVPPHVRILGRRSLSGWRVSVLDNGVGIPEERRHDVFSLFSRVESGVEGHGIGLATVARIVTGHGGRVGVDEVPGGGTEVWFELPALLVDPEVDPEVDSEVDSEATR